MHNTWLRSFTKQLGSLLNKLQRKTVERDGEWAWLQSRQWTRPQRLRAYFFKILIPYLIYLAFKFGWVVNNTFFCGVTNSEHTFNIDFTRTLSVVCETRRKCIKTQDEEKAIILILSASLFLQILIKHYICSKNSGNRILSASRTWTPSPTCCMCG